MPRRSLADCRLYTFLDTAYLGDRDPSDVARALVDGGSDLVQVRAKGRPLDEVRSLALAVAPILEASGVRLVVNDHPEVAAEVGAPVLHLGQEDFFDSGMTRVSEIRPLNPGTEVGLSTHAPDQCERAVRAGADYVAIGPVFATGTKPTARPVTLDYVRWAAATVRIPWFAIGGVNEATLESVLSAGARRICVVSAILGASDVTRACRRFRDAVEAAR